MTIIIVITTIRYADKLIRVSYKGDVRKHERVCAICGIIISSFFSLVDTLLPKILGSEILPYIWLFGIGGGLLGQGLEYHVVHKNTKYPSFKEQRDVFLLSSLLTMIALIVIHILNLNPITKGLCTSLFMIFITILSIIA